MDAGTELRERWEAAGQGQIFRFWSDLDDAGRSRLAAQLEGLDPELEVLEAAPTPDSGAMAFEPAEPSLVPGDPAWAAHRDLGRTELAEGRVAILTVAGGLGSRLGFAGPKGAFPIGPVSDRSLFEVFAQGIAGLGRRYARPLPWVVLTSPATDAATRRFFERRDFLGLDPSQVRFVRQGTLPVLGLDGRVLLAAPDRVAEAPDGHGGAFAALRCSGALAELASRGVERVFYHHVDNPLVHVGAPAFLGLHRAHGAEMSCKAVEKLDPLEQMGFLAQRDGRPAVVEYSEVPPEVAGARRADGRLRFRLGSVGIHVFERSFLERVAEGPPLPLHRVRKPFRALGATDRRQTTPAWKLERFVFDALARARVVALMETGRRDEYSPVKNARGPSSPARARRDLVASYRRWIEEAGLEAPEDVEIEMDHAHIHGPDDLRRSPIRRISDAAPHVRIAKGAER